MRDETESKRVVCVQTDMQKIQCAASGEQWDLGMGLHTSDCEDFNS